MIADLGHFSLCLGWLIAVSVVAGTFVIGIAQGPDRLVAQTRLLARATIAVAACTLLAFIALAYSFVRDDYSIQYVWQYSNRTMPWVYKITAVWGGMDGSMLLWCLMVAVFGATVAFGTDRYPRRLAAWVLGFINTSTAFFLSMTVLVTNPFRFLKSDFIPPDGNGLNPLLQNEYMAIHPPMLYLGFTALAVPYAFCMAALAGNELSTDWTRLVRRWTLIGWTFLTAGIVLGGHWAYLELGWGGFWAWDPVENSSFLPWLTATALLHSIMVQERKGMLKTWNVSLALLTYGLTVFGTFLTRSGVVQSVHAFASTDVGWVFLLYLSLLVIGGVALIVLRREELKPDRHLESLFSREAGFLVNNLILLSICFAVLWGVLFPVFSEWFTGVKQTVGIPFFNAVTVPLFLLLIFTMAVGPLLAWRKSSLSQIRATFLWPFVVSCTVMVALAWAGILDFYPLVSYGLAFFAVATILGELGRGMRTPAARQSGTLRFLQRHRIRYGGYFVHLGVALMTVAITASMAHKVEREFMLAAGESYDVGRFSLYLENFHAVETENYSGVRALVKARLRKDGSEYATLHPELRMYRRNSETTTEVALKMGPREDLYVVLAGLDDDGRRAALKVFVNPLQVWLWFGAIIMCMGGVIVAIPSLSKARAARSEGEERVAQALEDLELDYQTGKVSASDRAELREDLEKEGRDP
jgi:cytochrome c-type biogenesis protein CcmF